MNGRKTAPQPRRAVVFASPALGQGLLQGRGLAPGCLLATSAYEAAAELLAGPAAVLVVDLRLLRPGHVRLIALARRAGAELWGVGPLPAWASSDQLAGMRLLDQGQLAGVLAAIAAEAPASGQTTGPGGAYQAQGPVRKGPGGGSEPLLTTEELNALLGDAT